MFDSLRGLLTDLIVTSFERLGSLDFKLHVCSKWETRNGGFSALNNSEKKIPVAKIRSI